jgi:hypothetical protein
MLVLPFRVIANDNNSKNFNRVCPCRSGERKKILMFSVSL